MRKILFDALSIVVAELTAEMDDPKTSIDRYFNCRNTLITMAEIWPEQIKFPDPPEMDSSDE